MLILQMILNIWGTVAFIILISASFYFMFQLIKIIVKDILNL